MKKKQQKAPEFITDETGQRIVRVALASTNERATLNAKDFHRLIDTGWSRYWTYAGSSGRFKYVFAWSRSPDGGKRTVTVARLIADAGRGQRVRYLDGDRLNLRRENLEFEEGPAHTPAAALLPNSAALAAETDPKNPARNFREPIQGGEGARTPPVATQL